MAGGKFCPKCGFSNPPERGACLMCYARLDQTGGGRQCPHCGGEVAANANFCGACGGTLAEGLTAVPGPLALAALLMETGGEVFAGAAYHEPAAAPAVAEHFDDFAPVGESEIPSGTVPEIGPLEGAAAAPPAPAAAAASGPEAVEEEEEEMFVPPPPGLVTAEPAAAAPAAPAPAPPAAEEFAPPPPPPAEEFAPPPPPPLEEEAFAPPPPPPDLMDLSEEPSAAPAAPAETPAAIPAAAPAAEATPAGLETADFDFGDWALETPEEEEKKE